MHRLVAAMILPFLPVAPALAQSAEEINATIDGVLGDHAAFEAAFAAIQAAVAGNEAEAVAGWVAYPFAARIEGEMQPIAGPEAFVGRYDEIVTEEVREAVAGQHYEDLFVNADGVMFGSGQMWIAGVCRDSTCAQTDVRIVAIQGGDAN